MSTKTEENEELQAKLAKAVEDNEKLEKKLTEAVKENEELQQKLIILEQDWQHESNLYSKSCHNVIELERKEITLLTQLDEVHNKFVEEKEKVAKSSQEVIELRTTAREAAEELQSKE